MTSEVKMPVAAYLTNDEEGSPAMLFFDWAEAWGFTEDTDPPQALVLQSDALAAIEAARVEARAKALEEAAAIVDEEEENARQERYSPGLVGALEACAASIRSLAKEAPHG